MEVKDSCSDPDDRFVVVVVGKSNLKWEFSYMIEVMFFWTRQLVPPKSTDEWFSLRVEA